MKSQQSYQTGKLLIGDFELESGHILSKVEVAYEKSGPESGETVLVCHALTGDQFAAGTSADPGWWSGLLQPGGFIDTDRYQIITFNVLGGCNGTTSALSIDPISGVRYASAFPAITIRDMVSVQRIALEKLGISHLRAVIGGSLGGMQVLEWGVMYPDFMDVLIPLAATPFVSDYAIAYNHLAKTAITSDPNWNNGNYTADKLPAAGLGLARMVGMLTYRSDHQYNERFRRAASQRDDAAYEVESYLNYQGEKLVNRFDANCYMTLLKAMNSHDIGRGRGGWQSAAQRIKAIVLSFGFSRDLLFPPEEISRFAAEVPGARHVDVTTIYGHDGFLLEFEKWGHHIRQLLQQPIKIS
ncbi:homoserine O-acetyltransferase [Virgibacillus sp. 7505]|uniref:homoserine O-acetyltransferase MetX n=1 Tax=Virgibacillus sp. 7505 TaxID=2022548 RepID=UPI000BA69A6F|nr:homoserine O-acetyltransferase [Virgibacillus sp. 7505]PAE15217.1 homoserine O-acetyltransferase [Virgibacillus sp. 7505]